MKNLKQRKGTKVLKGNVSPSLYFFSSQLFDRIGYKITISRQLERKPSDLWTRSY